MAQVTPQTEPRPSLLFAVFFSGLALMLAQAKGYVPSIAGLAGHWIMMGSIGWLAARAWYLRKDVG
jgi:hypothetical protein